MTWYWQLLCGVGCSGVGFCAVYFSPWARRARAELRRRKAEVARLDAEIEALQTEQHELRRQVVRANFRKLAEKAGPLPHGKLARADWPVRVTTLEHKNDPYDDESTSFYRPSADVQAAIDAAPSHSDHSHHSHGDSFSGGGGDFGGGGASGDWGGGDSGGGDSGGGGSDD